MTLYSLRKKIEEQIANLFDGDCRISETGELLKVIKLLDVEILLLEKRKEAYARDNRLYNGKKLNKILIAEIAFVLGEKK